jgi:APA family basic amino acid/polyamine antiporter
MRIRRPELPRPFKLGGNIKIKGRELPISAILGFCALAVIWVIILITQPYSRWVGLGWMVAGIIIYYFYRKRENLPLTHTPKRQQNQ